MNQAKQAKREREKKQREKEKKDAEQASRRHLAGMRVIQKNLVYVVGLNPPVQSEDLHSVLRSEKYFGQYGKILKIVVNRRNPSLPPTHHGNAGFGVYVTFARKEDASRCIAAVDGSISDGRVLRAAHGTTKYCSSYLRGQPCPNPNCMFLHEPGEEADSYTRQDLSTRQGLKMEERSATHGLIPPPPEEETEEDDETSAGGSQSSAWGKHEAPASTTRLSASPPALLSNANAFPSLAESANATVSNPTAKKVTKKDPHSLLGGPTNPFSSAFKIFTDAAKTLNGDFSYKLTPEVEKSLGYSSVPLFHFSADVESTSCPVQAENQLSTLKLVDSLLCAPFVKNYGFTRNTGSAIAAAKEQELRQHQQQTSTQQFYQPQPQRAQQFQNVSQQPLSTTPVQLNRVQLQQQVMPNQHTPISNHVNIAKLKEMTSSATPPPPGLFTGVKDNSTTASAELLSHLIGGK
ncbi:unnamed protein product [Kuraishia capsulata CBS 1993]|uniref:RRM domain-containing protein n=1 Tax=Kuraishia capsulata CBS 1993 TaxID=1382522 RepID=W6MHW5_9ASCO|nr:uncharacterized protein KUCA_T00001601001 [Kuraishia capsulata CBS 1993]CDK25631.1 unnamed protein product [Kuraishia capsulata CBS 1993]